MRLEGEVVMKKVLLSFIALLKSLACLRGAFTLLV